LDKGRGGNSEVPTMPLLIMSTPFIRSVIARIPVHPIPLFQDDVDSADSHDDNAAVEETLATQGPETSGEDNDLGPKVGLMDLTGYVCRGIAVGSLEGNHFKIWAVLLASSSCSTS
jgi:hypothetical protein